MNQTINNLTLTGKIIFNDGTQLHSSYASLFSGVIDLQRNPTLGTTTLLSDKFIVANRILTPILSADTISARAIRYLDDIDSFGNFTVQTISFTSAHRSQLADNAAAIIANSNSIAMNTSSINSIIPNIVNPSSKLIQLADATFKTTISPGLLNISNLSSTQSTSFYLSSMTMVDGSGLYSCSPTQISLNGAQVTCSSGNLALTAPTSVVFSASNTQLMSLSFLGSSFKKTFTLDDPIDNNRVMKSTFYHFTAKGVYNAMAVARIWHDNAWIFSAEVSNTPITFQVFLIGGTPATKKPFQIFYSYLDALVPLQFTSTSASDRILQNVSTINFMDVSNTTATGSIIYDTSLPTSLTGFSYTANNLSGAHNFSMQDAAGVLSTPVSFTAGTSSFKNVVTIRSNVLSVDSANRCDYTTSVTGGNVTAQIRSRSSSANTYGQIELQCDTRNASSVQSQNQVAVFNPYGIFYFRGITLSYQAGFQPTPIAHTANPGPAIQRQGGSGTILPITSLSVFTSTSTRNLAAIQMAWPGSYLIQWNIRVSMVTSGASSSVTALKFGISTVASNSIDLYNPSSVGNVDLTKVYPSIADGDQIVFPTSAVVSVNTNEWVYLNYIATFSANQLSIGGIVTYTRLG